MKVLIAVVAACLVLTGCGTGDGGNGDPATTSPAVAAEAADPWDLPLEQRPPLFDPCTEIPEAALAEADFTPEQRDPSGTRSEPGSIMACRWNDGEVLMSVLATWKHPRDVKQDRAFSFQGPLTVSGKSGQKVYDVSDMGEDTQHGVFFTSRGTVLLSVAFVTGLHTFKGKHLTPIGVAFDSIAPPLIATFPEGDFS